MNSFTCVPKVRRWLPFLAVIYQDDCPEGLGPFHHESRGQGHQGTGARSHKRCLDERPWSRGELVSFTCLGLHLHQSTFSANWQASSTYWNENVFFDFEYRQVIARVAKHFPLILSYYPQRSYWHWHYCYFHFIAQGERVRWLCNLIESYIW